jgi:hypothetical protein
MRWVLRASKLLNRAVDLLAGWSLAFRHRTRGAGDLLITINIMRKSREAHRSFERILD